jgi:hypothetical protein
VSAEDTPHYWPLVAALSRRIVKYELELGEDVAKAVRRPSKSTSYPTAPGDRKCVGARVRVGLLLVTRLLSVRGGRPSSRLERLGGGAGSSIRRIWSAIRRRRLKSSAPAGLRWAAP